ncbi:HEAT repeat domain-containing protein [Planctomycetota bacterium]
MAARRGKKKKGGYAGDGGLGTFTSAEDIEAVRDVCTSLAKAEKGMHLYPAGSGVIRGFIEEFFRRLSDYLRDHGTLELSVFCEEITFRDELVYDGGRTERNFAVTLFDGGIKNLILQDGIDRQEVEALIDAIKQAVDSEQENVMTLLWEKELKHVAYVTVDFFEDEVEWTKDWLEEQINSSNIFEELTKKRLDLAMVSSLEAREELPDDAVFEVFQLTKLDLDGLQKRITEQGDGADVKSTIDLILYLLTHSPDPDLVQRQLSVLQNAFRMIIHGGDIEKATETLGRVRELLKFSSGVGRDAVAALQEFIESAGDPELVGHLAKRLRLARDPRPVLGYVKALGKYSINAAGALLGLGPHDPAIIASVTRATSGDSNYLKGFTTSEDARVSRVAVRALSTHAGASAITEFFRAAEHKDQTVRAEAYAALAKIGTPASVERMFNGFQDDAAEVRKRSFDELARHTNDPQPQFYPRILQMVEDKKFANRPDYEKQSLLSLLALFKPADGLEYLKRILLQRSIFRRKDHDTQKILAVRALERLSSPEAEQLLQQAQVKASEQLRSACAEALVKLRRTRRLQSEQKRMQRGKKLFGKKGMFGKKKGGRGGGKKLFGKRKSAGGKKKLF